MSGPSPLKGSLSQVQKRKYKNKKGGSVRGNHWFPGKGSLSQVQKRKYKNKMKESLKGETALINKITEI